MAAEYLYLIIAIFGISGITIYVLGKFRIPSIIGFLVGGIIIGPSGLNILHEPGDVEVVAELGVILLMFTIGLEFSLQNLLKLRTLVFGAGFLQVSLATISIGAISFFLFSEPFSKAILIGLLVSLSSTAIVFKMIQDRGELHTPYGRVCVGILIFQDLCVVVYMLMIPVLAGAVESPWDIAITIFKAVVVICAVLFSAKWGTPWLLHEIVKTRSRELFIITIIVLSLGTALLTHMMGLSLALGAFLAGVVISESEYSAQTVSDILPLKEIFSALFFISIGMLLNLQILSRNVGLVVVMILIIGIVKFITTILPAYFTGQSLGNALRAGLYLFQIGEFSFVVAVAGKRAGLMAEETYQVFLSAAVITMMATPFLISLSSRLSSAIVGLPFLHRVEVVSKKRERQHYPQRLRDHVIIIGFGINGSNLTKVLRHSGISYVVLELNSNTVRSAKKLGEPIHFGDGTSSIILRKLGIQSATVLVVAISDASATRAIVKVARTENPYIFIIARTRYVSEVEELIKSGANEVIPEEFETSVEIFSKVLNHYRVPMNDIKDNIEEIRADNYKAMRTANLPHQKVDDALMLYSDIDMATFRIRKSFHAHGRTLAELDLRAQTGVTVISTKRNESISELPPPTSMLLDGDILTFIGKRKDIEKAVEYLETGRC
jgi:monovalent cation:H+ antiporter-2, CPA2 family